MKFFFIIFVIFILFSACNARRSNEPIVSQDILENDFEEITQKAEQIIEYVPISQPAEEMFGGERFSNFQGTVYDTFVNADHVNIRNQPSLQSDILYRVSSGTRVTILGTSKDADTIDGHTGHWLLITILRDQPIEIIGGQTDWARQGWVFSRFVDNGNIVPNEIRIVGSVRPSLANEFSRRLYGTFMNGDTEVEFSVWARRWGDQPFYTFVWNHNFFVGWTTCSVTRRSIGIHEEQFRFDTVPGTYIWYRETGELRHVSYIGGWPQNGEKGLPEFRFTDDLKFILRTHHSPGGNSLRAWRVDCGTLVYVGEFLSDLTLNDHTIEVVYDFMWWNMDRVDDEMIAFRDDFIANSPRPSDMTQRVAMVIAEFDLDTGVRRIIEGRWVFRQ